MRSFLGNPPFLGGGKISGACGKAYLAWLLMAYAPAHGNADLCAYVFRRAFDLLTRFGTLGFIATNTISQGATRTTGPDWICAHGGEIYNTTRDVPWPGGAAVTISILHLARMS
jgi:hypothetical protein